jgi:hypothetical protein
MYVDFQRTTWFYMPEDRTLQYSLLLICCLWPITLVADQILNVFCDISIIAVLFLILILQNFTLIKISLHSSVSVMLSPCHFLFSFSFLFYPFKMVLKTSFSYSWVLIR